MQFVDFFAGIGGIRLGLEQAGHKCVGFCEFDKYARTAYKAMYDTEGEWENHDVRTVKPYDVPAADLWCFGFPCQDISAVICAVLTPNREEKRQNGRRMKEPGEPSFTLTAQDRHGVAIAYDEQNKNIRKDGTVGTLTCDGSSPKHNNRIIEFGSNVRIRRLTPRECWRLQGFPDEYFDKAKAAGISDTQLYKQAGNGVTVNVSRAIGERLKEVEEHDE